MASYRKRSSTKQEEKVLEPFTESEGSEFEQEDKELSEFLNVTASEIFEQIEREEESPSFIEPVIAPTEYIEKTPNSGVLETAPSVTPAKKLKPKRNPRNIPRFSKVK